MHCFSIILLNANWYFWQAPPSCVFSTCRSLGKILFLEFNLRDVWQSVVTKCNALRATVGRRRSLASSPEITSSLPSVSSTVTFDTSIRIDGMSKRDQWVYVAEVVERVNMLLYIFACVVTPSIIFLSLPKAKVLTSFDPNSWVYGTPRHLNLSSYEWYRW